MIEKLVLENFQAHKRLVIKFDPRVTVVCGDTDVGKSAMIRALGWVAFNKPNGDDFIRWGTDAAVVTLEVDGQIIVRSRGKGENAYNVNGDEFVAFGNDVPERVAEVLRMGQLNFQAQHDSPFWFTESAGEVSRRLNTVINLGVIDDALSEVGQKVRKAKSTVEVCEERISTTKKTRDGLAYADAMDAKLQEVEELALRLSTLSEKRARLGSAVESLTTYSRTAKAARQAAERGGTLLELAKASRDVSDRAQLLHEVIVSAEILRKKARQKLPDLQPLTQDKELYESVALRREALANAIGGLRTLWRAKEAAKKEYEAAHTELHDKMDGQCPLCGKPHK